MCSFMKCKHEQVNYDVQQKIAAKHASILGNCSSIAPSSDAKLGGPIWAPMQSLEAPGHGTPELYRAKSRGSLLKTILRGREHATNNLN